MVKVVIAQNILAANDSIADDIRQSLAIRNIHTINIMSSPGAGKTTLLERTIERLHGQLDIGVIDGDIETSVDAERILAVGGETVQINTRGACHLEAHMIRQALDQLTMASGGLLFIENIGNLICPAHWDLGEDIRVVMVCTTEGDDKPEKYPQMFASSQVMIINKIDLQPYVDYDVAKVKQRALAINSHLRIFEISCRTDSGLDTWCEWLVTFARGTA